MSNRTKGSIISAFPDSIPEFIAQSELLDPSIEDSTLAEGRDANQWSAEILAIIDSLGVGGRAEVTVSGAIAVVEALTYVYQGSQKEYPGTAVLNLQAGQINYIYLDLANNVSTISTSNWPTTAHLRLAIWDDTASPATLTDHRPHDLKYAAEYQVFSNSTGQNLISGSTTIINENSSKDINYGVTFSSTPILSLSCSRGSDSVIRSINFTNKTTSGFTVYLNSVAPAGGITIDWLAVGQISSYGSA
ncbi:MAG: hypothetical protein U9P50_00485 [Patescibacteria group bacterium]|nr:hypothetical protein [Patescibacteria group bacterium]